MKLQFAFGNPRKGKAKRPKRKKGKLKKVAKRRKKAKTISVKPKFPKVVKMAKSRKRSKRRKNPQVTIIRKGGRIIGREVSPLNRREKAAADGRVKQLMARYKNLPAASAERGAIIRELVGLKNKTSKAAAVEKTIARYKEDKDVKMTSFDTAAKGASVAKKKRKSKKSKATKRRKKKAVKAAAPKKARKVRRKKSRRKHSKRRTKHAKKVSAAKVKRTSKRKGGKRRKSSKKRRRARMIRHSHSSAQRHIKKGTTFRFKSKSKRGKRSISVTGRVKINPFRRNPMKNLSAQSKKYLGLDATELGSLALGGALVPVVNAGLAKVPGMNTVVAKINEFVGPQAVGSVIPILTGVALNVAADKVGGQGKDYLKMAGEGLAAAGIIGLVMGISQNYIAPALGLSGMGIMPTLNGINFTPSMRGINFTPKMNGINYTPKMSGMGIMPQLNGADFGRSPNYGGGGGSPEARTQRSDFGAWESQDSEANADMGDEDNSLAASMN